MPAIDQAAVSVKAPAAAVPRDPAAPPRRTPPVALAALGFALLWVPLTLLALVTEWRGSWGVPEQSDSLLGEYVMHGSAISGPLLPQVVLVALALAARRDGVPGRVATGLIGLMGCLIAFNGAAGAATEAEHAPQVAASAAGAVLGLIGVAMAVLAVRRLFARGG